MEQDNLEEDNTTFTCKTLACTPEIESILESKINLGHTINITTLTNVLSLHKYSKSISGLTHLTFGYGFDQPIATGSTGDMTMMMI